MSATKKKKKDGGENTRAAVVIPCHNEEKRLDSKKFEMFIDNETNVDFVFVNDGSSDSTLELLRKIEARNPRCRVLDLRENRGKAAAVHAGFQEAFKHDYAYVGFWDADLATPLDDITRFVEIVKSGKYDCVFGCRVLRMGTEIKRKTSRHYIGRIYATIISLLLGLPIYDTQCGAKIFRRSKYLEKTFEKPFRTKWVFDVEIIARMKMYQQDFHKRVYECPLEKWTDVEGSQVSLLDGLMAFVDLFKIWTRYK
jgi:glycosyltransferase involved in cell wall biosynthesis